MKFQNSKFEFYFENDTTPVPHTMNKLYYFPIQHIFPCFYSHNSLFDFAQLLQFHTIMFEITSGTVEH